MTKLNDLFPKELDKHRNVLLYNQDLRDYYEKYKNRYPSIYISTPKKGKTAIQSILKKTNKDAKIKNKTIIQLIEEIIANTEDKRLYIFIDSFEMLSKRELIYYQELENAKNIQLIVNIKEDKPFIDEDFLEKFIILNSEDYNTNRSQSINLNYPILLLLSLLVFLLFIRTQLGILNFLITALWFTFLMYRTLYYITR